MFAPLGVRGLTDRARSLAATLLEVSGARLALVAAELDEFVTTRALGAACVAGALGCALLADVMVCGAVLWSLPESRRGIALLGLALANAAMAGVLIVAARRIIRASPAFAGSVDELRRDACALSGADPAYAAAEASDLGRQAADPVKRSAAPASAAHP